MIELLDLPAGARVLDIGCGKGEVLVRLAERHGIEGTGVDLSPFCVREARARAAIRLPHGGILVVEADGAAYAAEAETFDLAICLGESFIFGGHRGTLRALRRFVRPGGLVMAGEPFWRRPPEPTHVEASGYSADLFATHAGNVAIAEEEGLTPLYTLVSSADEWDRYLGFQWRAAEQYAAANPDDPDVPELLARQRRHRDLYLRWERETLGWAVYLFRW